MAERTIAELAPLLASGSLEAEELLAACLAAIRRHDRGPDGLGAILRLDPRAEAEARGCDADRRAGHLRGPLHGVPMIVKDNIDVAGLPTTSGNRAMAGAMPWRDAAQVARLRAAGAVIVGKANMSELSFEIRSRSSLGGDVRNPFARAATSGGSSGGTAVAVAAGFAVAGLGTDTGGSIRVPAAYNGLVGLRPTHGLLDLTGVAPLAPSTDTIGPIARSIADAALLFRVMAGLGRPPLADMPDGVGGLRVGLLRQAFGADAAIVAACEAGLAALGADGVTCVDPVVLPEELLPVAGEHIVDAEFAAAFDTYLTANFAPGTAPRALAEIVESGAHLIEYRDALLKRLAAGRDGGAARNAILARHRRLGQALASLSARLQLDAIAYPTSMVTPDSLENPKGGWAPELAACSGWPALTVPVGRSAAGVPIGLELLAPAGHEAVLLRLGRAVERNSGPRPIPPLG